MIVFLHVGKCITYKHKMQPPGSKTAPPGRRGCWFQIGVRPLSADIVLMVVVLDITGDSIAVQFVQGLVAIVAPVLLPPAIIEAGFNIKARIRCIVVIQTTSDVTVSIFADVSESDLPVVRNICIINLAFIILKVVMRGHLIRQDDNILRNTVVILVFRGQDVVA